LELLRERQWQRPRLQPVRRASDLRAGLPAAEAGVPAVPEAGVPAVPETGLSAVPEAGAGLPAVSEAGTGVPTVPEAGLQPVPEGRVPEAELRSHDIGLQRRVWALLRLQAVLLLQQR
jgi:hypothetical protein